MIKRVLVPLDGSPVAEAVLPLITHVAQTAGAEVELITVLTPYTVWDAAASMIKWDAEEAAARDYIRGKARELEKRGLKTRATLAFGPAADAVLDAAGESKADFIAMTTHGRSGITRFALGSVADKLLHAEAPLLVVRPGSGESGQHLFPAQVRRVLVPLDGSDLSLKAIPLAEEMATIFQASLLFCSVVSTDWIAYSGMETPTLYQDVFDDMTAGAEANIEKTAAESRTRGFNVDCVVGTGSPAAEIERVAAEHGVGLIVMSTHGRSGPSRWLLGSIADSVVRHTHLPCLLVRARPLKQPVRDRATQPRERAVATARGFSLAGPSPATEVTL